jgi:hypothetical protein
MNRIKRTSAIVLGIIIAMLAIEATCRFLIKYPSFPYPIEDYYLEPEFSSYLKVRIYPPFQCSWNVEGGLVSVSLNNHGLPGSDFDPQRGPIIHLLGNSYVQAEQYDREIIASSVFQKLLQGTGSDFQVVNLGASGVSSYVALHRHFFFQNRFPSTYNILVMERMYPTKYQTLEFSPDYSDLKPRAIGPRQRLFRRILHASSALTVIKKGLKWSEDEPRTRENSQPNSPQPVFDEGNQQTINTFQSIPESHFILINIIPDQVDRDAVDQYCREHGVKVFTNADIMRPDNRIHGVGHLTERGNRELGEFIYKSFRSVF